MEKRCYISEKHFVKAQFLSLFNILKWNFTSLNGLNTSAISERTLLTFAVIMTLKHRNDKWTRALFFIIHSINTYWLSYPLDLMFNDGTSYKWTKPI